MRLIMLDQLPNMISYNLMVMKLRLRSGNVKTVFFCPADWAEACIEGKDVPDDVNFPKLAEEIIRYHHTYRPHEKADIIYKRIDR